MKILYSKNYIERDLYVLEYQNKYLMVYRSSGLNPGRKGRFLPFCMLATPDRITISSPKPGYIYKEFYFEGHYTTHGKHPELYNRAIAPFLLEIEAFLEDKRPPIEDYDHVKTYKDILPIANQINDELAKAIKDIEPFDWATLADKEQHDNSSNI